MPSLWFVLKYGERIVEDDGEIVENVEVMREGGVIFGGYKITSEIKKELHYQLDKALFNLKKKSE